MTDLGEAGRGGKSPCRTTVIRCLGRLLCSTGRFLQRNMNIAVGSLLVVAVLLFGIVGSFSGRDPFAMNLGHMLEGPSTRFPFGTDDFGRDILSRTARGALMSVLIALGVTVSVTIVGTGIGLLCGYVNSLSSLMRIMDAMMAFPSLLLAIGLMAALGQSLTNVIVALLIVYTPRMARVAQAMTIGLKDAGYVEAARALGAGHGRVIMRHILPNGIAPLTVQAAFVFAFGVLAEGGLSFVGIGVQPPTATLGNIVGDARPLLREAPWMSLIPGSMILLLVMGVNMLGDGLRVAIDPKHRRMHVDH